MLVSQKSCSICSRTMGGLYQRCSMSNSLCLIFLRYDQVLASWHGRPKGFPWWSLSQAGQGLRIHWRVPLCARHFYSAHLPLCSEARRGYGMVPGEKALPRSGQRAYCWCSLMPTCDLTTRRPVSYIQPDNTQNDMFWFKGSNFWRNWLPSWFRIRVRTAEVNEICRAINRAWPLDYQGVYRRITAGKSSWRDMWWNQNVRYRASVIPRRRGSGTGENIPDPLEFLSADVCSLKLSQAPLLH